MYYKESQLKCKLRTHPRLISPRLKPGALRRYLVTGKFAEAYVIGQYKDIAFIGDAKIANEKAGGTEGWILNEAEWAQAFTNVLVGLGYDGIRIHFDDSKDVEVAIFNLESITFTCKCCQKDVNF